MDLYHEKRATLELDGYKDRRHACLFAQEDVGFAAAWIQLRRGLLYVYIIAGK